MMNICFVTPYSPKEITGVGKFVEDICRGLKEKGIDSVVITKHVKPVIETEQNIIDIDCERVKHLKDIYLGIKTAITIFKRRKEIDLLHLQTPLPQSAFSAVIGRILGIPVVTTVHGVFPAPKSILKNFFYKLMEKITYKFSNAITFVSKETKDFFGISSGIVILNGVDTERFFPSGKKRKEMRKKLGLGAEFVLLYLGRWVAHKGIYELLDVFTEIKAKTNKELKLVLIGTGETAKVLNRIKERKIENYVLALGKVDNVHDYFCMSDVFVLFTSPLEGLPLALLEAMSCGVTPIASSVSGIPEVIKNRVNGLLVEQGNKSDLIQKIVWCIDNEDERVRLGKNAAKTVREEYSLDKMVEKYVKVYNDLGGKFRKTYMRYV